MAKKSVKKQAEHVGAAPVGRVDEGDRQARAATIEEAGNANLSAKSGETKASAGGTRAPVGKNGKSNGQARSGAAGNRARKTQANGTKSGAQAGKIGASSRETPLQASADGAQQNQSAPGAQQAAEPPAMSAETITAAIADESEVVESAATEAEQITENAGVADAFEKAEEPARAEEIIAGTLAPVEEEAGAEESAIETEAEHTEEVSDIEMPEQIAAETGIEESAIQTLEQDEGKVHDVEGATLIAEQSEERDNSAESGAQSEEGRAEDSGEIEFIPVVEDAAAVQAGIVERAPAIAVEVTETPHAAERGHLVRSAALVAIGNLGSSLLGMVRQIAVTSWGTAVAGPFNAALTPVTNFYQLLINGSTDGALIPVFNEYAAPERRQEGRRVVFTVVNLVLIIALIVSIGYLFISPWFVDILVTGYKGPAKALTLQFSQIIFFSSVVLGPFAVLLAALFSLKEFGWPAFATASYHAGIILGALAFVVLGSYSWGVMALPIGLLIGAAGQIVLLLPGIRRRKLYYMFVLDLKHPALKRIYRLYWPIAISYVFSTALTFLDLHFQSLTPQGGTAATTAMNAATVLIQFPIGLVAQALSVAVLPTLSEHAREGNTDRFKAALLLGIRLGLLLMIPAMTGLLVLRTPIVYMIFAHRRYSVSDANLIALALQNYAYQLPFVAIDQLMIAAFYARKNTKIPVIIYVVSCLFYLVVALPFYNRIGVPALAFANTVQNSAHAIILLFLLRSAIGSLHIRTTIPSVLKICLAAALMAAAAWLALFGLGHLALFSLSHFTGQILTVIVAGGVATLVYFGAIMLFKVEEIHLVKTAILAKLGKK